MEVEQLVCGRCDRRWENYTIRNACLTDPDRGLMWAQKWRLIDVLRDQAEVGEHD